MLLTKFGWTLKPFCSFFLLWVKFKKIKSLSVQLLVSRSNVKLVTFQSSGFSIRPQIWRLSFCRHLVLRRLRSPAFDRGTFAEAAVRQVAINRSPGADPPIGPKEEDGPGVSAAGCLSLRLASQLQPRLGPRLAPPAESSVAGPARSGRDSLLCPRLESFLTRQRAA